MECVVVSNEVLEKEQLLYDLCYECYERNGLCICQNDESACYISQQLKSISE